MMNELFKEVNKIFKKVAKVWPIDQNGSFRYRFADSEIIISILTFDNTESEEAQDRKGVYHEE